MKAPKTTALAAAALFVTAAFAAPSHADDTNLGGVVIGGAIGGLLGSTLGKGRGRLVATATGALVGSMFSKHLAQGQRGYVSRPAPRPVYHHQRRGHRKAHRHHRRDRRHAYRSRNHGNHNSRVVYVCPVTPPVTDTVQITTVYDTASGRYYREYQREVIINGQPVAAYGRACQQPDGSWQIIDAERQTY
jgi:surface antigen